MTDFNARYPRWWKNNIANSTGQEIDSLTLSAGYKQILINLPMLQITLCHVLTFYFVLTKIKFKIIELMCQSLTNVLIILSLVRLTSMYHSLQYVSVNSEIIVRQMWKISKKQHLTLIRVKLLKIFPQIKQLNTLTKHC